MTTERILQLARIILRLALGITFLVSVANRFGALGPYGAKNSPEGTGITLFNMSPLSTGLFRGVDSRPVRPGNNHRNCLGRRPAGGALAAHCRLVQRCTVAFVCFHQERCVGHCRASQLLGVTAFGAALLLGAVPADKSPHHSEPRNL